MLHEIKYYIERKVLKNPKHESLPIDLAAAAAAKSLPSPGVRSQLQDLEVI